MIVVDGDLNDDPSSPLQLLFILTSTLILQNPADSVPDAYPLIPVLA